MRYEDMEKSSGIEKPSNATRLPKPIKQMTSKEYEQYMGSVGFA